MELLKVSCAVGDFFKENMMTILHFLHLLTKQVVETLLTACCPDPRYCIACVYCIVLYLTEGGGLHVFFVCVVLIACRPGLLLLFSRLLQSHLFIANCPRASANMRFFIVKFLQFGVSLD